MQGGAGGAAVSGGSRLQHRLAAGAGLPRRRGGACPSRAGGGGAGPGGCAARRGARGRPGRRGSSARGPAPAALGRPGAPLPCGWRCSGPWGSWAPAALCPPGRSQIQVSAWPGAGGGGLRGGAGKSGGIEVLGSEDPGRPQPERGPPWSAVLGRGPGDWGGDGRRVILSVVPGYFKAPVPGTEEA